MKKRWWDTLLVNNPVMKKISLALRRGRQLQQQLDFAEQAHDDEDDLPTIPRCEKIR
jgi:hypothetical protein